MTKQAALEAFLVDWLPSVPELRTALEPQYMFPAFLPNYQEPRPTKEALAEVLLSDVTFQSLRLGTWLGTPDGKMIAAAVAAAVPAEFRWVYELVIDSLKLAAALQRQQKEKAATGVLVGAGIFVLVLVCAWALGGESHGSFS